MPFDNPPDVLSRAHIRSVIDGIQPEPVEAPKPDRWNSHLRGTPGITRTLIPLSDTMVLMAMRDILRHHPKRWARGTIGNCAAACAVGWMSTLTEPTNRPETWNDQSRRIIVRLYQALPPSARKLRDGSLEQAIAAYNDTRSNATLDRWLTRAIAQ